jgi:alkylhydroperoxidase/carboxymuconolactone decarboxylase family protein YurZ
MTLLTQNAIRDLDPVFAEMAAASFRPSGAEPDVTPRERILITLVTDVCGQVFGMPFDLHVRAALDIGLDADDLRELLRFTAYESGYPAALAALERLTEIEREHHLPGPTGQGHQVNADGAGSPMPAAVRAQVQELGPAFIDYMDLQSRMRADMSRISVREKAFTSMAVDVVYQTLRESFRAHVGRALGAGATHAEVRAAVRATAPSGMARTWRALHVLEELLAEYEDAV